MIQILLTALYVSSLSACFEPSSVSSVVGLLTLLLLADGNTSYTDDWCVVTLIQGVCFRAQGRHDEAQQCCEGILERYEVYIYGYVSVLCLQVHFMQ